MDSPISNRLRITFLAHWIISAILGAALWIVPARTLILLGWVGEVQLPKSDITVSGDIFVDPFLTRLLGAALLALALSSFLGWRAKSWGQVAFLVQQEALFCVLGVVAFFYVLIRGYRAIPLIGWAVMILLAVFAIAWGVAWRSEGRTGSA